jgi:hypothetical protein
LFFQDEARIGQKGRVCHVWWKRGQRPPGLCDKRFTYAYIFAAVEPGTDNAFALVMPYADTPAMQTFLDQFSETIAQDEHAVMILDQAGWHGSAALVIPDNITLVDSRPCLPPRIRRPNVVGTRKSHAIFFLAAIFTRIHVPVDTLPSIDPPKRAYGGLSLSDNPREAFRGAYTWSE